MFEVTMAHLEAIAAEQIAIATILVAKSTVETVYTFGGDSPELAADLAALAAANAAMAAEVAISVSLEALRATIIGSLSVIEGIGTQQVGENGALTAIVAGTA